MTREEALAEKYVSRSELINKIYNDHEAQLKAKDEETLTLTYLLDDEIEKKYLYQGRAERLEIQLQARNKEIEALQLKSCDRCAHEAEDMVDPHCAFCSRSCKDNYEPKDTQC